MAMHVADSFRSNMRLAARNFAATELLTDISVSATQLRVKDSTKYPSLNAGEYFLAVLSHANDATKKEIIKVTGISGDTWTIQRAYEGTTAFAFPSKSAVECRLTAGTIGLVQGMTTKRPSGTSHVAYPYHEYYVDGGSVVTFDLANFMDGQRAIVRCWQCQTAQRVTLRTGASDFFYLADARSYAEVMRMGDVFHVTEHGLDAYSEWSIATKGATIPVGSSVRVTGVDGVFDISFAQGASAKSPISVKFEGLGLELGRTAKIKLLGGEQFDVPSRDSELIIDSDCVLTFQRVNSGRWGILDGVGLVGSYHALSRRVAELEQYPTAPRVVAPETGAVTGLRWVRAGVWGDNAGETKWWFSAPNILNVAGIVRVRTFQPKGLHSIFTLPQGYRFSSLGTYYAPVNGNHVLLVNSYIEGIKSTDVLKLECSSDVDVGTYFTVTLTIPVERV